MSDAVSRDQRYCITGGGGFLGSFVVERLISVGVPASQIAVPRRATCDLTRLETCEQLFADLQPEIVIHLAAEVGGIGANRANPGRYFYANMAMGLNLIECARRFGVSKFVQVGTICAYPKHAGIPFREDELWNGYPEETNAPYGIAKKALLTMCQAYRDQYGLNAIYLLPVNLYGPGDNFDLETSHVIPAMIHRFIAAAECGESEVTLWGDGSPTREFLYVDDAAEAVVLAAQSYNEAAALNIGTGREVRIGDLAVLIARETGFGGRIEWDATQPNGQPRRCLDVSRAKAALGFEARTALEDGLRRTIAWYREHRGRGR